MSLTTLPLVSCVDIARDAFAGQLGASSPPLGGSTAPVETPTLLAELERSVEVRVPELDCSKTIEDGYQRGKRKRLEVVSVDGRPVEHRTANAYWAMREAAAKDGVYLDIWSGFRTQAEQTYFWGCYRCCCCNGCAKAAKPGYSNHQSGRALDIGLYDDATLPWLRANARAYGFSNTVKSEPWHWEFRSKKRFPEACKVPPTP